MAVHNDQLTNLALSFAPSRAPPGANESASKEATQPAPRAVLPSVARQGLEDERGESSSDPPGASGQRDMPARVRPGLRARVQGDCREHGEPAGWLAARSGTKRWNAKAREGRNRRGYPLAARAHSF